MSSDAVERTSDEYIELLADVFSEIVQKGAESKYLAKASDGEVTPALMQCLQFIFLHGRCSVRRIAEGLSISEPAGSQLVERLVQKHLVVRQESKEDRRQTQIYLTDAGRELVQKAREERSEWFRKVSGRLSDQGRQAIIEGLEEFVFLALENEQDVDKACAKCGIEHLAFCVLNRAHEATGGGPVENY